MKPAYALTILLAIGSLACEQSQIVGSSEDTEIRNMSFTLDTTYVSGASLFARGKAQNNGRDRVAPPWYVEAQFYTDSTYRTKLGGEQHCTGRSARSRSANVLVDLVQLLSS